MNYRFYQDQANAHIAELEQRAQGARLARRRGLDVEPKPPYLNGSAWRLVTQLRLFPSSHRPGFRASAHLSLVPPKREFDPVTDYSSPACAELGGASHIARVLALRSTGDDSTPHFEEGHFHNTGITNIDSQMSLQEDEFGSTEPRTREEHRAVHCGAMQTSSSMNCCRTQSVQ